MSLEEKIVALTASLDKNTAAILAAKGASAATASAAPPKNPVGRPPAAPAKPTGPSFDAVKLAATDVMNKLGKPRAQKIILEVGGAGALASVKPEKFPALIAAFEAALSPPDEDEVAEGEDEL